MSETRRKNRRGEERIKEIFDARMEVRRMWREGGMSASDRRVKVGRINGRRRDVRYFDANRQKYATKKNSARTKLAPTDTANMQQKSR